MQSIMKMVASGLGILALACLCGFVLLAAFDAPVQIIGAAAVACVLYGIARKS